MRHAQRTRGRRHFGPQRDLGMPLQRQPGRPGCPMGPSDQFDSIAANLLVCPALGDQKGSTPGFGEVRVLGTQRCRRASPALQNRPCGTR